MKNGFRFFPLLSCLAVALSANADLIDRAGGIKIGDRMTLRPSVALSLTYDSNVHSRHDGNDGDAVWSISPAASLAYDAETWSLLLSGYYNFRQYFKEENRDSSHHSFGEDLRWNWANSTGTEKGWSLILGQSYKQIVYTDDMVLNEGGHHYHGDTRQFQFSGALQRRLNQFWHGDVNADYYWLDYMNGGNTAYYGWDRWRVGAEVGFAPSRWTDILLSGTYQGYNQDNSTGTSVDSTSEGYSLHAGLGSYMTDRISYRLMAGWSSFEYGGGASKNNGFTYTATANWKLGETWNTMLLASSYYQPSERQRASKSRVDAISWGLAKVMVRGKLRGTLDLRYRRETNEYYANSSSDYVINVITGRIGLNYSLNRFLSMYGHLEYQRCWNDHASERNYAFDYDRFRATVGLMLSY